MARGQLGDTLKGRIRIRNVAEIEKLQESFRIELREFRRRCQNSLDLGAEVEPAFVQGVVQRLLAYAVAR